MVLVQLAIARMCTTKQKHLIGIKEIFERGIITRFFLSLLHIVISELDECASISVTTEPIWFSGVILLEIFIREKKLNHSFLKLKFELYGRLVADH